MCLQIVEKQLNRVYNQSGKRARALKAHKLNALVRRDQSDYAD